MNEENKAKQQQQATTGGLIGLSPSETAAVTSASKDLVGEIGSIANTLEKKCDTKLAMESQAQQQHSFKNKDELIKPVFKRYIILFLFCMNSGCKAFQWIQVPAATTKATVLYGVDNYIINLASIVFMLSFVVLSWPACYIIERVGMRRAVLMASFGTSIGATVKCFSCHEEGVWLLMLGQTMVSLCEQLIFSLPSRIASVWFPDNQVSFCVAMCIVGNQMGVAVGFLVPHWFLNQAETEAEIGMGFYHMFLWTAGLSGMIFIMCVVAFDDEPKYAPGAARLEQRQLERDIKSNRLSQNDGSMVRELASLSRQISELCHNRQLIVLSLSYGLIVGVNYTIQTLLDQMMADTDWPDKDLLVGTTGFIIVIAGTITSPIWGMIMDACHAYKQINVIIALGNVLSLAAFSCAIVFHHLIMSIYITAFLYGLFSVGYWVSTLEYAVELTYPSPELCTASIMNVMPQIGGTICILFGSYLVDNFGNSVISIFNVGITIAGLLFVMATKEDLRRQKAANKKSLANNDKFQEAVDGQQQLPQQLPEA